jgi:urease accessory protein
MPDTISGFEYGLGFALATAPLHVAGISPGLAIGRMSEGCGRRLSQLTGGGMALAGVAVLAHAL